VNTFNRIFVVLLCVLLVVAAVAIITLAWTIPNRSINGLTDAVQWLDDNDGDLEKAVLTGIAAFVGLAAFVFLIFELIPRQGKVVKVNDLGSGTAKLSIASINQRIEEAVSRVPYVSEVRADVQARRKGVLVSLDLQVDPDANLVTVTDQACQTAQEFLTERVHVQVLKPPTARLRYRDLRVHRGGGMSGARAWSEPVSSSAAVLAGTPAELQAFVAEARGVAVADAPEPSAQPERMQPEREAMLATGQGGDGGEPGTEGEEPATPDEQSVRNGNREQNGNEDKPA
jgi:hypothetical protein